MTKTSKNAGLLSFVLAGALMTLGTGAAAKTADPSETCKNQLLTYRQRYQCQQDLDNVQTKADQKKIVRKFTDLIRAAEKAKEEADKDK